VSPRVARRIAAGTALCFALAASACSSEQQEFAKHLERAQEHQQQGRSKEALSELRSALQIDPGSAEVNYRIAELLAKDKQPADAVFFFRETTRIDPTRSDAALAEAKLILFDDTARAGQLVEEVLEREPGNVTAQIRRSEVALARGDSAAALEAARRAVELAPDDGMTHMQLAIVHMARLRELTIQGAGIPDSIRQDAEQELKRAAALFPRSIDARIELARLYASWKDHGDQAMAAFRDATEVAETDTERGKAAAVAIQFARATRNEDFERASLQTMVEAVPANLGAWDALARLEEKREKGAGERVYARLLELRPQDVQAHLHYAVFLFESTRYDDAFRHLEEQAGSGSEPPLALDQIVSLRLRRGETAAARAAVERLAEEFPSHPRTALAGGRVALAEKRFDEATSDLHRYLESEETVEGQKLLATAELRRRNFPAAIAAVDRAMQMRANPEPALLRLKATVHAKAGDYPVVLQTLNRIAREAGALRPTDKLLYTRALYATGRRVAGRALLEEQLATAKPHVRVLLEFARRESAQEPKRAREYLDQVLAVNPKHAVALRLRAELDLAAGRSDEALARIDAAASAGPLSPPLVLLRAQILAANGDWARAEEEARRAYATSPELPGAIELLTRIYRAQHRLDEMIASLEEAERAGALPVPGLQLLASLHDAAGHRAAAKDRYEKVLAARSDLPAAKAGLAQLLAEEGNDLERALVLATEALQAEPEQAAFADTLGTVKFRKGLFEPALQHFQFAVEVSGRATHDLQDEQPLYHHHRGKALKALGRKQEAAAAFARALELDANFEHADEARRELEAAKSSAASKPG
jgi:tetratricopeptide (TPR) repeat protein